MQHDLRVRQTDESDSHREAKIKAFIALATLLVFAIALVGVVIFIRWPIIPLPEGADHIMSDILREWPVYFLLWVGGITAFVMAPLFWMRECKEEGLSGRIEALLFRGKARRVLTTLFLIFGSYLLGAVVVPTALRLTMVAAVVHYALFILITQVSIFMTFKVGPLSFAYRDRILVEGVVRSFEEGTLTDGRLESVVRCILTEARRGNTKSVAILAEFRERRDGLGERVRGVMEHMESV
ncbi:MAG: hypothetical protein ACTSVD_03865 [Candidatus Thorarchaeota archaeon]